MRTLNPFYFTYTKFTTSNEHNHFSHNHCLLDSNSTVDIQHVNTGRFILSDLVSEESSIYHGIFIPDKYYAILCYINTILLIISFLAVNNNNNNSRTIIIAKVTNTLKH